MPNQSRPAAKPTTHFEQVPVETVKQLVSPAELLSQARARPDAGHFHGVQFYDDADALCRIVGGFLGEGLEQDALAVMIVTPDHAARIESCLRARRSDVDALKRRGQLGAFDARDTLDLFMIDGMPNPSAFRRTLGAILNQVHRGREHCAIRAYGEMVDLLWRDGAEAAAIRLETLWNQLARTRDFELLCGYSMGNFYKGAALDDIKGQHTHLVTDDGHAAGLRGGGVLRPDRSIRLAS